MTTNPDFREFLKREFICRSKKNENYSLRAFARNIGVPASSLSLMMNGSRPISKPMREKIGLSLGLKLNEISKMQPNSSKKKYQYQKVELSEFQYISEWYHYAILELTKIKGFKPNLSWIAKKLNITKIEASSAVENLERLSLLQKLKQKWLDNSEQGFATNISPGLTSKGAKLMQQEILKKSIKAIDEIPLEDRDHTSLTIAINKKDLKIAREKIKNLRRELDTMFEKSKNKDSVYLLSFSMFPVTNDNQEKKS